MYYMPMLIHKEIKLVAVCHFLISRVYSMFHSRSVFITGSTNDEWRTKINKDIEGFIERMIEFKKDKAAKKDKAVKEHKTPKEHKTGIVFPLCKEYKSSSADKTRLYNTMKKNSKEGWRALLEHVENSGHPRPYVVFISELEKKYKKYPHAMDYIDNL